MIDCGLRRCCDKSPLRLSVRAMSLSCFPSLQAPGRFGSDLFLANRRSGDAASRALSLPLVAVASSLGACSTEALCLPSTFRAKAFCNNSASPAPARRAARCAFAAAACRLCTRRYTSSRARLRSSSCGETPFVLSTSSLVYLRYCLRCSVTPSCARNTAQEAVRRGSPPEAATRNSIACFWSWIVRGGLSTSVQPEKSLYEVLYTVDESNVGSERARVFGSCVTVPA
mmetsp:Transcript_15877/g.43486  ORF Transcript_15877/g.43486 Transcript_15877/m.43486 type:complete len:228 (+) Transcript_15877:1417-2100(+)